MVVGSAQPLFGLVFSRIMTNLTIPMVLLGGPDGMMDEVKRDCLYLALISVGIWLATFVQKKSFYYLSEQVTQKIRHVLYDKILQKNIGWFDLKENGTGNLSSSLASDTQILNMAAAESIGPVIEGFSAISLGIFIACFSAW